MHGQAGPSRPGRVAFAAAGLITLLAGVAPVAANPVPPSLFLLHVQGEDPYDCAPPGVQDCQDLVQITEASGTLEFVVYLQRGDPDPLPISHADFALRWESGWVPLDLERCTDAVCEYELFGNELILHFEWPDCPVLPPFQPICKLIAAVDDQGCLEVEGNPSIDWGCPPHAWREYPIGGRAQAGTRCDYTCFLPCDGHPPCEPRLTPPALQVEISQGSQAHELVQSLLSPYHGGCGLEVEASEPWILLDVVQLSETRHDLHVTIDAGALAPGEYDAWIRATSEARDCCPVHLRVTPSSQSAPEEEPAPADEAMRRTWGAVKDMYRSGLSR